MLRAQQMYSKMRYFFEPLCRVRICSVSDTSCKPTSPPAPPRSTRRRPVWYRVQTGAACPASGRVRRCAVSCMVYLASGTACAAACAVQPVRVRWGLGSPPEGYTGSAGGGAGHARDKIFQRKRRFSAFLLPTPTPPSQIQTNLIVQVSKNSKKYKKTPFGA